MTAMQALLGFTAWTLAIIVCVFLYRGMRLLGGTPINHWPRGAKPADDPALIKRMEDAHANCLENLPIFAVIVLAAAAIGKLQAIEAIAPCVLYSRVGQTLAHLSGGGRVNVLVRATFWFAQIIVFVTMLVKLV